MKKKVVILLVVLVVTVGLCIGAYFLFTREDETVPDTPREPDVQEVSKGSILTQDMPRVDASLATQPLLDAYVEYFAHDDILEDIQNDYTNTHPAYEKLVKGETDLIIVTEPSEEELQMASDAGVELVVTKVVNEGFVFFVNANNPVDDLSLEEIVDIYSGNIN